MSLISKIHTGPFKSYCVYRVRRQLANIHSIRAAPHRTVQASNQVYVRELPPNSVYRVTVTMTLHWWFVDFKNDPLPA